MYKITNTINGKIYVGIHRTSNLDDGYMGSGKAICKAIEKYGIENFQKEIIEMFDSAEEMYAREKQIVNEEFLNREDVYNIQRGGHGGFDYLIRSGPAWRQGAKTEEGKRNQQQGLIDYMSSEENRKSLAAANSLRMKTDNPLKDSFTAKKYQKLLQERLKAVSISKTFLPL